LDQNVYFTSSVNMNHKKWLHSLMERCCQVNHSISVLDERGVVWSLYKSPLNCLFTASNAFSIGNSEDQTVSNYKVSELERDILSKLSRRTLYQLVRKLGLTWEDVRESPSEAICNYLEGIEDEDQSSGSSMVSEISSEAGEAESNGDDMDSEQDEVDEADQRPV